MSKPIKKIVIVGRDADAWITALFLKSGLDKKDAPVSIELVELPSNMTQHDFYSVLPSIKNLHKVLGANEASLTKSAKAQHFFAQKFSAWNNDQPDFIHAYDKLGLNFNSVDFYQYWLKATRLGLTVPLEEFNLGTAATKLPPLALQSNLLGNQNSPYFGYHLSAQEYIAAIARATLAAGVIHKKSEIQVVNIDDAGKSIASIKLADNSTITADIFIDASGSQRVLIDALQSNNLTDWSEQFLCDRVITASINAFEPTPSFSLATAFSAGWYGLYPLQDRTGMKIHYSSKHASKRQVLQEVSTLLDANLVDLPEQKINCGILKQPWIGNCIAVGETAVTLESSDALDLQPILTSLVQLRELFPNNQTCQLEANVYNRKLDSYYTGLRDFQLAHYLLNGRKGEPFWNACHHITTPKQLVEKLSLFRQSGQISIAEYDTFQQESWTLLFNGHGLTPKTYHPLVDRISDEELKQQFNYLLKNISQKTEKISAN